MYLVHEMNVVNDVLKIPQSADFEMNKELCFLFKLNLRGLATELTFGLLVSPSLARVDILVDGRPDRLVGLSHRSMGKGEKLVLFSRNSPGLENTGLILWGVDGISLLSSILDFFSLLSSSMLNFLFLPPI